MKVAFVLAVLLASGAMSCGPALPGDYPRLANAVAVHFPRLSEEASFRLRADGYALNGQPTDWRLLIASEWVWLNAGGEGGRRFGRGRLPAALGWETVELPAGAVAWVGDLEHLLRAVNPAFPAEVRSWKGRLPLFLRMLDLPENESEALSLAVAVALVESFTEFAPRLLTKSEGSVQDLDAGYVLSGKAELFDEESAGAAWRDSWTPRAPTEGFFFVRFERPVATFFPRVSRFISAWGFEPPPVPGCDFALELHALYMEGCLGLLIAVPEEWGTERIWPSSVLEEAWSRLAATSFLDLENWEVETARLHGSVYQVVGASAFRAAAKAAVERDRPPPFAEYRWAWPRGSLGLICDLDGLRLAAGAAAPLPIPQIGHAAARGRVVEFLAGVEGADCRFHASWPKSQLENGALLNLLQTGAQSIAKNMAAEWLIKLLDLRQLDSTDGLADKPGGSRENSSGVDSRE